MDEQMDERIYNIYHFLNYNDKTIRINLNSLFGMCHMSNLDHYLCRSIKLGMPHELIDKIFIVISEQPLRVVYYDIYDRYIDACKIDDIDEEIGLKGVGGEQIDIKFKCIPSYLLYQGFVCNNSEDVYIIINLKKWKDTDTEDTADTADPVLPYKDVFPQTLDSYLKVKILKNHDMSSKVVKALR
jgi:hypothetical protein